MAKRQLPKSVRIEDSPKEFYHGCAQKKKFPSKKVALGVARAMNDPEVKAYKCRFCPSWHLGH
jgi:hypothetical protein